MPRGAGEALIAREERRIERLGERDIDGVIGCQIVPQIPDAPEQQIVRMAPQGKIGQIGERFAAPLRLDLSIGRMTANDLHDLDVEQMRCVQGLPGSE